MPIRTRASKATKQTTVQNDKTSKSKEKTAKQARKPLADKTNSTSDDNKSSVVTKTPPKVQKLSDNLNKRTRKPSKRFIESDLQQLKKLSTSLNRSQDENATPPKVINTAKTRPKRVHNLPSRLSDFSITPKLIPLSPRFSSTPIAKLTPKKDHVAKRQSLPRNSTPLIKPHQTEQPTPAVKRTSPRKRPPARQARLEQQEHSTLQQDGSRDRLAVYEFTFDPREEPRGRRKKPITRVTKPRVRRGKKAPPPPQPPIDIMPAPSTPESPPASPPAAPSPRPEEEPQSPCYSPTSFFSAPPRARSSALPSPWRADYAQLGRWPSGCYVKPDMTPAVECSFVNPSEGKKHVYTNMLDSSDMFPAEVESRSRQTSILDFIRETAENKQKKSKSPKKSAKQCVSMEVMETEVPPGTPVHENAVVTAENPVATHENPVETSKNQLESNENPVEAEISPLADPFDAIISPKRANKSKDKYFGFDDSENRENVSPMKPKRGRQLRTRTRAVLKEINAVIGPMRANITTTKPQPGLVDDSIEVDKTQPELVKDIADVVTAKPAMPEPVREDSAAKDPDESTNVDDEAGSIHLFEDIDTVHLKPPRRSYTKSKKLTTTSPSSSEDEEPPKQFQLPLPRERRAPPRRAAKMTRKEEAEAEAWAAAFNSMCEDVQEYRLVLE